MAGKYGSASVTCTLEDAPGGTARNILGHILTMGGVKVTSATEDSTAFGVSWRAHTPTGMNSVPDITLEGFWDTTATTGPHVVLGTVDDGPQDDGRELIVGFGDSKTFTIDVRLVEYEVIATVGQLTRFRALLRPTGTGAWA